MPFSNTKDSHVIFSPTRYSGCKPDYYTQFNPNVTFEERFDQALNWLQLDDEERPSMVYVYLEQPHRAEHNYGPNSTEALEAANKVDVAIKHLVDKLTEAGLIGCVNLVIVSDHGMQAMELDQTVVLENYLGGEFKDIFYGGPFAQIYLSETGSENVDEFIEPLKCKQGSDFLLYKKNHLPVRFHYGGSDRIGDVLLSGRPGKAVFLNEEQKEKYNSLGDHGFDNNLMTMRTLFGAIGPDIAEKKKIDPFQNIEADTFSALLGIKGNPNNGTEGVLYSVLKNPPEYPAVPVEQLKDCPNADQASEEASNCPKLSPKIAANTLGTEHCLLKSCNSLIRFDEATGQPVLIEGYIDKKQWDDSADTYSEADDPDHVMISPFMKSREPPAESFIKVPKSFAENTWKNLVGKVEKFSGKEQGLYFLAGPIYDSNGDGLRDSDEEIESRKGVPTHIFFVFLWCGSGSLRDGLCSKIRFLPYVFDLEVDNINCLEAEEYFTENVASMRDIELLTSLEFFVDRQVWTPENAVKLRTLMPRNKVNLKENGSAEQ